MTGERYFGLYHAIVVNDADPEGRRRLQVEVPDVFGHGHSWAQACVPVGSSGSQVLSKEKKSMNRRCHFAPSLVNKGSSTFPVR